MVAATTQTAREETLWLSAGQITGSVVAFVVATVVALALLKDELRK